MISQKIMKILFQPNNYLGIASHLSSEKTISRVVKEKFLKQASLKDEISFIGAGNYVKETCFIIY